MHPLSSCFADPAEVVPVRITRHGTIGTEDDSLTAGVFKQTLCFFFDGFFRAAVKDTVFGIIKSTKSTAITKNLTAFFQADLFDDSCPINRLYVVIGIPGQIIMMARPATDMQDIVVAYAVSSGKDLFFSGRKTAS